MTESVLKSSHRHELIIGNCLDVLKTLPSESVDLTISSPPYLGLRDYRIPSFDCSIHNKGCVIGLENNINEFIDHLVAVFSEVKRVLKKSGSFYMNMGDCYAGHKEYDGSKIYGGKEHGEIKNYYRAKGQLPDKCLMGMPWRTALALVDDGWILRNSIIWHKPNSMPSSVQDRLSNTYEFIFHFVKNQKYYYDLNAIRIPHKSGEPAKFNVRVREVKAGRIKGPQYKATELEIINYDENKMMKSKKKQDNKKYVIGDNYRQGMNRDETLFIDKRPYLPEPKLLIEYLLKYKGNYSYKQLDKLMNKKGDTSSHWFTDPDNKHGFSYPSVEDWIELKKILNLNDELDYYMLFVIQESQSIKPQDRVRFVKQDNVPGKNANIYAGFNDRWIKKTKHDIAVGRTGNVSYTDSLHNKPYHPDGKNPGDVVEFSPEVRSKDLLGVKMRPTKWGKLHPNKKPERWFSEGGKNPGDFWDVVTASYPDAHFAVYPEAICVQPIKSSCPIGGVVLDPFSGSGTTAKVAQSLGRNSISIDINPSYAELWRKRLRANEGLNVEYVVRSVP